MNTSIIPKTDSIQELAQFWDTHDLTDYEDELEEITETVFEPKTVKIHLEPDEAAIVAKTAKSKGLSHTSLIKGWVLERIHGI